MAESDLQHDVNAGVAWGVLALAFGTVFLGALVFDIIGRWGGPLILEIHLPTIFWIVAGLGRVGALARMNAIIKKLGA